MATIVKQKSGKRGKLKPTLVNKLELNDNIIYSAVFIPHEDSIITVASDKLVIFIIFLLAFYQRWREAHSQPLSILIIILIS